MANHITIHHDSSLILLGQQTSATKLWQLDIQPAAQPTHWANATIGSTTPTDMVTFAHATLFSPTISTLAKARQHGHLPKFAGLALQ